MAKKMCEKCDDHFCEYCEDMSAYIDVAILTIKEETGATFSDILDAVAEWSDKRIREFNEAEKERRKEWLK